VVISIAISKKQITHNDDIRVLANHRPTLNTRFDATLVSSFTHTHHTLVQSSILSLSVEGVVPTDW